MSSIVLPALVYFHESNTSQAFEKEQQYHSLFERIFCSQNWHHLFSRWNLLSLNVVFCLCLFTAAIVFFE